MTAFPIPVVSTIFVIVPGVIILVVPVVVAMIVPVLGNEGDGASQSAGK